MADFKIFKQVSTLPTVLVADAVYLVRTGVGFDLYSSDSTGTIAHKLNSVKDIKWLDILVGASSSSFNTIIATGTVVNYVYAGVTYYRLIPSGTAIDAFYSTFSGGVLSGLVNYKIQ